MAQKQDKSVASKKEAVKEKTLFVTWISNVKYHGKRYRVGETTVILPEDEDGLRASGVIQTVK